MIKNTYCLHFVHSLQDVLEACNLQRRYSQHYGTKTKTGAWGVGGGAGALILLSTQATKWTQDWLRITMGHTKKSDWYYRSKVMCA